MPKTMVLEKRGKEVLLRAGKQAAIIPRAIAKQYLQPVGRLSAAFDQELLFLAPHSDLSCSYPLVCIEQKTGKKLWENQVWDAGNVGGTGVWYEYVAVVPRGERVFVIGAGTVCFCIEAFDRKTGKNDFRFASRYWAE
jgi:hypothetical protein